MVFCEDKEAVTIRIFLRIKLKVTHDYANRMIFTPTVIYFLTITTATPSPWKYDPWHFLCSFEVSAIVLFNDHREQTPEY